VGRQYGGGAGNASWTTLLRGSAVESGGVRLRPAMDQEAHAVVAGAIPQWGVCVSGRRKKMH
jgi:hypothetical protein